MLYECPSTKFFIFVGKASYRRDKNSTRQRLHCAACKLRLLSGTITVFSFSLSSLLLLRDASVADPTPVEGGLRALLRQARRRTISEPVGVCECVVSRPPVLLRVRFPRGRRTHGPQLGSRQTVPPPTGGRGKRGENTDSARECRERGFCTCKKREVEEHGVPTVSRPAVSKFLPAVFADPSLPRLPRPPFPCL